MFENAKWISANLPDNDDGSLLFRKEITVDKAVNSAVMHVVGLGYGEFTVNGKRVTSDVLTTPFTRFDSRVLYLSYDISNLLVKGANAVGAFAGNGWYNDVGSTWNYEKATWRDQIKLIMQIDMSYEDGTKESFVTDTSWKADKGAAIYNHIREGEIYDARLEQTGWDLPGFNDGDWANALICRGAGGKLEPASLPPIRIIRSLPAVYLGNNIYDFGENTSGWVKIKAAGERGREISIHYSELYKNNDIDNEHINMFIHNKLRHCDKYIMSGNNTEEWEPRFVYHGFRYVKVQNAPENFEIEAKVIHTDLEIIGEFECSDDMLNKIHMAARRSTLTNFHSIPTDCPHREQNGWTGDALISAQQALMNYDMKPAYKKWLNDFKDVQRPSGQLPGIIPTSNWGYNWGSGPAWDSALIQIPWQTYQITGDASMIAQMWDNMKLYMKYMDSMAVDYTVNYGLGDWCPPKDAVFCPAEVTDTAYYYANAVIMAKCAKMMCENHTYYENLAEKIKAAYRNKFLNNPELYKSQTFLACGIYQGLYNETEIPHKAKLLAELVKNNDYHIDCGILGAKYIFTALSENGYTDVVYKMVTNPAMPSYAYWINQGMTTLCESWEMYNSCNHNMFSEVDYWFYKYLAGIRIDENGLVIKPCIIPEIKWVKAKHRDVTVERDEEKLYVTVPCSAKVIIGGKEFAVEGGKHTFDIIAI
jgi:alpha-L-rhamnosidase